MTIHDTLNQRKSVHGDYISNAMISQHLKSYWRSLPGWGNLSDIQRESLDMFAAKICRIFSGDPNYPDHWHDIAGYATLAERELQPPEISPVLRPLATSEPSGTNEVYHSPVVVKKDKRPLVPDLDKLAADLGGQRNAH